MEEKAVARHVPETKFFILILPSFSIVISNTLGCRVPLLVQRSKDPSCRGSMPSPASQRPAEFSWKNTLASESRDAKLYSRGNLSPALDTTRRNSPSPFLREERSSVGSPSREIPPLSAPRTAQHLHSPLITFLSPNHIQQLPFVLHVTRSPQGLWATLSANSNSSFALRHLRDISC